MARRTLAIVVVSLAVGSAACAARFTWLLPLFWIALLLSCLALRPARRHLLATGWVLLAGGVFCITWLGALDHEAAVRHGALFLAAAFVFAVARLARVGDRDLLFIAGGIALTGVTALFQAAGGLQALQGEVTTLAPALREAGAVRLAEGRVFGTSALPSHFAALQLMAIPLLVGAVVRRRDWVRWLAAVLLVVSLTALVLTRSLAGVAILAILIVLAGRRRIPGWALTTVLGLASALAIALLAWRQDLASLAPFHLRLINWKTALAVLAAHPWLGVGLGGVGQGGLATTFGGMNITPYVHDTYLQLLAELGVAGCGLVIAGVAALVRVLRRGFEIDMALALAVLVVPLHNLVDFSAYAPEVLLPWAVLLGVLAGRAAPAPARVTPSWLLVPLLAGGFAVSSLAAVAEYRTAMSQRAGKPAGAEAAAAVAPWAVTPALTAAGLVLSGHGGPSEAKSALALLQSRAWVWPASAGIAEARARLLLALGRPGEALVWARVASARAPWRKDLVELEARCGAAS